MTKRAVSEPSCSSPVSSATADRADDGDHPIVDLTGQQPQREAHHAADECASMRSTAKCVLPVLVGPKTAATREEETGGRFIP